MKNSITSLVVFILSLSAFAAPEYANTTRIWPGERGQILEQYLINVVMPRTITKVTENCHINSVEVTKVINRADGISYANIVGERYEDYIDITKSEEINIYEMMIDKYDMQEKNRGDGRENYISFQLTQTLCVGEPIKLELQY